jgi:hypothetical protein
VFALAEAITPRYHDSERAAMIYLHGCERRQQATADRLRQLASDELKRGSKRNAAGPGGHPSHAPGTEAPRRFLMVDGKAGKYRVTCSGGWAPRARLERAT